MKTNKKPVLDLMVDIETLSTDRDKGLVLSIGVQSFSLNDEPPVKDFSLYTCFIPDSGKQVGRVVDQDTWDWWQKPSMAEARYRMELDLAAHARTFYFGWAEVHGKLAYLADHYELHVWSKGMDFDFPMIESSLRDAGLYRSASDLPWKYYNKHDMRTVIDLAKRMGWEDDTPWDKVPHSALEDCRLQIMQLKKAIAFLSCKV